MYSTSTAACDTIVCRISNKADKTGSRNNLASFSDNNIIPNAKISSTPRRKFLTLYDNGRHFLQLKVNMAAEPEVLVTSLLENMETPFQSRNSVTELTACTRPRRLDRQRTTLSSEYPRWRVITGSGDIAIFPNIVVVPNPKQAYAYSYTHIRPRSIMGDSNFYH